MSEQLNYSLHLLLQTFQNPHVSSLEDHGHAVLVLDGGNGEIFLCRVVFLHGNITLRTHFCDFANDLCLVVFVQPTDVLHYLLYLQGHLDLDQMIYLYLRDDGDATGKKLIIALFFKVAFQEYHIDVHSFTVGNQLIHLLHAVVDDVLEGGLLLATNQIGGFHPPIHNHTG